MQSDWKGAAFVICVALIATIVVEIVKRRNEREYNKEKARMEELCDD